MLAKFFQNWLPILAGGSLSIVAGAGCSSIGPSTVRRDRLDYACALSDSWKEQLLLNIVKTRYGDSPSFLEVISVVSGYTVEMGLGAAGQYSPASLRGDTFVGGAVSGKYTDRPTISYAPMAGEKFARGLMSPVPLDAVWSAIIGGVPADFLLGLTLQSMGAHRNLGLYAGGVQSMEPGFVRTLELLRALQEADAFESEIIQRYNGLDIRVRFPSLGSSAKGVLEQVAELKTLLDIPAQTNDVGLTDARTVESGSVPIRTRSLMQILSTLGAGVQIPPQQADTGGVVQVDANELPIGFRVYSGKDKPKQPFLAVPYDGHWYWIERQDLSSKKTLTALTLLLNFLEGGAGKSAPILTIPTN